MTVILRVVQHCCSDETFYQRKELFETFEAPFFVPGDNEWTDCHRQNNGLRPMKD